MLEEVVLRMLRVKDSVITPGDMLQRHAVAQLLPSATRILVLQVLRLALVRERPLCRAEVAVLEAHLGGVSRAPDSGTSRARECILLLQLFFEEKATAGEAISSAECEYVEYLLGQVGSLPSPADTASGIDTEDDQTVATAATTPEKDVGSVPVYSELQSAAACPPKAQTCSPKARLPIPARRWGTLATVRKSERIQGRKPFLVRFLERIRGSYQLIRGTF